MGGNSNDDGTVTNTGSSVANQSTAIAASATSSSFSVVNNSTGANLVGDVDIGSPRHTE